MPMVGLRARSIPRLTVTGVSQAALVGLLHVLRNRGLSHAPLAGAGAPTLAWGTAGPANDFDYMIEGQTYRKAAAATLALTGLGLVNTTAGQFCKVRLEVAVPTTPGGTDGPITAVQGPIAASQANAPYPARTLDANKVSKATLAVLEVPASFTFGTTNTNVAGFAVYAGDPDLGPNILQVFPVRGGEGA